MQVHFMQVHFKDTKWNNIILYYKILLFTIIAHQSPDWWLNYKVWKSALQILQMPEESPSLVRVYLSTTSWSTPLLTSFLWCDLNAISLPAIRSTSKFSKFLWEQFRFFFEVKVSSEIPQWNKYAMRSYASRKMYVMYPTSAANEFKFCWVCGVLLHQRSFHEVHFSF
jgi:hypothetical protein